MSQHRSRRTKRPMMLTAAAGAGIVLSAPAASLLIAPAEAQAAPLDNLTSLFGGGLAALGGGGLGTNLIGGGLSDPGTALNPVFDIASQIPGLNIFVGN